MRWAAIALLCAGCGHHLTVLGPMAPAQAGAAHAQRRQSIVLIGGVAYAVPAACFAELSTVQPAVYGATESPAVYGATKAPPAEEKPAVYGATTAEEKPAVYGATKAPPAETPVTVATICNTNVLHE